MASNPVVVAAWRRERPVLQRVDGHWRGKFQAMASPCLMLMDAQDGALVLNVLHKVAAEAWRIEDKFSRYVPGNIMDDINSSAGSEILVDEETANLLDFAERLYRMSDGRFDISSGALRKVWDFDGSDRIPRRSAVQSVLQSVGWDKIFWNRPVLQLCPGMEIDLGGIGKEYAVDRVAALVRKETDTGCLINFGGDIVVIGAAVPGGWRIGIESVDLSQNEPDQLITLINGGLATSGDVRRFLLKDGVRYGHLLDPRTGWPVENAPRSVTVAADTCTQAGMLATLAMLSGDGAGAFLAQQSVQFWCRR